MKILILCFICIFHLSVISQTEEESQKFESIYYEIAVNLSSSNPTKALHLADSLYNYSANENQKIKSLMLSASIYTKQEKSVEAIEYAQRALKFAEDSKDYSFQARIYGFMSTQYRSIGISDKGKEFIQKGLAISSKMDDKNQITKYQAMANHELADYAMDDREYEKAIDYMNLAILGYEKEENPRFYNFQIANAEEVLGRCHLALGNKKQALKHYSKANNLINKSEAGNSLHAAVIYQGLGAIYLDKKQIDSAGVYLHKALRISEGSDHGTLKELLYESMSNYYDQIKEPDSAAIYASKFRDMTKVNRSKKNQMVNSEFNRLTLGSEDKTNNTPIYIGVSVILGLGIILTIVYMRRKKTPLPQPTYNISEDVIQEKNTSTAIQISDSTQKELLDKLKEFEASEAFLDRDMSYSVLVSYLNTNAKYLNYILKNVKNKDFNTYINDLRIENIISKLKSDPKYLKYKISYLAEISGFSSHSNFSANFKRITHLSPSEFIESIKPST